MKHFTPKPATRNARVFLASILSYLMLAGQVAPLALASTNSAMRAAAARESGQSRGAGQAQGHNSSAAPAALPAAAPVITATKADSFSDPNSDGKVEPGQDINYEVTVSNTGTADATGVVFNDDIDDNTTLSGVVTMSPLAREDMYAAPTGSPLTVNAASGVLANDSGLPAPSAVAVSNGPTTKGGTVTLNTDGSFTYTPPAGPFSGADSFTYTATNTNAPDDTATVNITFNPGAANDSTTVTEDSGANTIDVLANDPDPDGGAKLIDSVQQPANGTVAITNGGSDLTYTPNADYCNDGTSFDTFTYTLTPGGATATVSVTVTCVDDNPTAVDDAATVAEDSGATAVDVLANDTDPDGGSKSVTSVTQPANGTVVITNGGADLTYQPNANYCNNGSPLDTFTYTLTPGGSSATVSMTVTCANDAPVATADAYATNEDTPLTVTAPGVLSNDTDVEGSTLSAVLVSGPSNASAFTLNADGSFSYTPNPNYSGPDGFTYKANDGGLDSNTVSVSITVNAVNDAPAIDLDADNDKGTSGADFAVTFTEGDPATLIEDAADATVSDVDNAALASMTVTITNLQDGAAEVLTADTTGTSITGAYTAATGVLTLTGPDTPANFEKVLRTVKYQNTSVAPNTTARVVNFVVSDGTANSNTAVSTVTVVSTDTAPTAVNDTPTVNEDSGANTINVIANDTDPDGGPISITSVTQPSNGAVAITNAGADLTYTPNANYCNSQVGGTPDEFTYTLTPGGSSATVSVTVTCVDDNPVAVNDSATVNEDSGANAVDVLANDTDDDGGPKAVTSVTQPANGTVVITGGGTGLTYAPNLNYCNSQVGGTPDTFTYTLTPGGSSATVSVTVTCVDDNATAVNDSATVAEDSGATTINVLANDTDPDGGTNSITSVTQPANGTVVITNGGADLTYAPNANYCNNPPGVFDTFTYTLTPGGSSATVSVSVTCVNDAPAVDPATFAIDENSANGSSVGTVTYTDPDAGQTHTCSITAGNTGGAFAINPTTCAITVASSAALDFETTPSFSLTVQVTDNGSPNLSGTNTITVNLNNVNEPPTVAISNFVASFTEDGTPTLLDDAFDITDPDSTSLNGATLVFNAATYQNGSDVLTFVNTANITGNFDAPTRTLTLSGTDTIANYETALRSVTFSTTSQAPGTARTVTVSAKDDQNLTGPGTAKSITVVPVNDPPVVTAGNTLAYTENDGPKSASPALTVTDVDSANLLSATVQITGNYVNGQDVLSYTTNGTITGTFNPSTGKLSLSGTDTVANYQTVLRSVTYENTSEDPSTTARTVTWQVKDDGDANTDSAPVTSTINVTAVNDAPVAGTDTFNGANSALANTTLAVSTTPTGIKVTITGNLLTNDTDVDTPQASLSVTPQTKATNSSTTLGSGTVQLFGNGTFTYTPPPGFTGTDSFTYTVEDNDTDNPADQTGTGTVNINVTGPLVWYVNNSLGAGNGTSAAPFNSIAPLSTGGAADALDGVGDIIFLFEGNSNTSGSEYGSIVLEDNQILQGQPQGLTVTDGVGRTTPLVTASGTNPNLKAATGNTITLGNSNIVRALDVVGSGAGASGIAGTSASSGNTSVTNTGTVSSTVTVSGASGGSNTGAEFFLNGGNGNFTFAAPIDNTSTGRAVDIRNRTGGTVTVSGSVTDDDGAGQGVVLNTNTGATVTLSGGVNLSTGANAAFAATGGGTVNVTGSANTLTTTTGTALNVANTNIGASGLNFRSISADGATNGIVLNSTGTAAGNGGLTVTGNGSAGTGGTIKNGATGISLTSTRGPSFAWMQLNDFSDFAIRGSSVVNFTMSNTVINGTNGNSDLTDDSSVRFTELTGTASITGGSISGGWEDNLSVINTAGTLDRLTVSGVTFGANSLNFGSDAALFEANNTAVLKVTVTNSTFTSTRGDHVQYNVAGGTPTGDFVLTNNTFSNNHAGVVSGGGGIRLTSGGAAAGMNVTYDISGNNIQGARGTAIGVTKGAGNGVFTGTLNNNIIGTAAVANSGSLEGTGINVVMAEAGRLTANITNNQIRQYNNFGIFLQTGGTAVVGNGGLRAVVTGNTISNFGNNLAAHPANGINGIHLNGGTLPGDTYQICLTLGGAGALENSFVGSGDGVGQGTDFRLRQRQSTTVYLSGYTGANNDNAAVISYVQSINAGTPSGDVSNTVPTGGGYSSASCPLPLPVSLASEGGVEAAQCLARTPAAVGDQLGKAGLDSVVAAAVERLTAAGLNAEQSAAIRRVRFDVADLPGTNLGESNGNRIRLDGDAGGRGWFVDATPLDDAEFAAGISGARRYADPRGEAAGRVDLLTVVSHELGHVAGLDDSYLAADRDSLMYGYLTVGERRLPVAGEAAAARPGTLEGAHFISLARKRSAATAPVEVTVNIGTMPAGKSVKIRFKVTVNSPFNGSQLQVSNQGSVSYNEDGGTPVLTDDTTEAGANDPTVTPVQSSNIRVNDATVAEPSTGSTPMLFAVTLSHPAGVSGVSLNYSTASGGSNPATGGAACGSGSTDYETKTAQTLNFAPGEQVKTVPVNVCADSSSPETDETFLLNISGAVGGQIADAQATGTITQGNPPGVFLISELRTSGPAGAGDDFVELYNNTDSELTVSDGTGIMDAQHGYGVFKMGADCNAQPVLVGVIPNGTKIPARGHYLFGGSQYSLSDYGAAAEAAPDRPLLSDLDNDANVGVFSTTDPLLVSSAARLDSVGFGSNAGGACALLKEGTALPPVSGSATQHSFFRKECDFSGLACTTPGVPKDTGDNSADFMFADTAGTPIAGVPRKLGAPGPQRSTSPLRRDTLGLNLNLLDATKASAAQPNRDRSFASDPANNSDFGTLTIRRRVTNTTGKAVTRLRFRVVELTTLLTTAGQADLRARTSTGSVNVGPIGDPAVCGGPASTPCVVSVAGAAVETPSGANNGGVNSTMTVALPGGGLADGASLNVEFLLGIKSPGNFRFYVIVEALP